MTDLNGQLVTAGVATTLTKTAQSLQKARFDLDNIDNDHDRLPNQQPAPTHVAYEVPSRASDAVHRLQISYARFQTLLEQKRQKSSSEKSQSCRARSLNSDGGPLTVSQLRTLHHFANPTSANLNCSHDQKLNKPKQDDVLSVGSQQGVDVDCDDGFDVDVHAMVLSTVKRLSSEGQTPQASRTVPQQVKNMTPAQVVEEVFSDDEAPVGSSKSGEMHQLSSVSVRSPASSVANEDASASHAASESIYSQSDRKFADACSHDQSSSTTAPSKCEASPTQASERDEICSASTFSSSSLDGAISQFPKAAKRAHVFRPLEREFMDLLARSAAEGPAGTAVFFRPGIAPSKGTAGDTPVIHSQSFRSPNQVIIKRNDVRVMTKNDEQKTNTETDNKDEEQPASRADAPIFVEDFSDPPDVIKWVEKCVHVFPDLDQTSIKAYYDAGWTIQALVDYFRSQNPAPALSPIALPLDQRDAATPLPVPRVGNFQTSVPRCESVLNSSQLNGRWESCKVPPAKLHRVRPVPVPDMMARTQASDAFLGSTVNVWIAPSGANLPQSTQSKESTVKDPLTHSAVSVPADIGSTRSSARHCSDDESNTTGQDAWSRDEILRKTQSAGTSTPGNASEAALNLQTRFDGHHQQTRSDGHNQKAHTTTAGDEAFFENEKETKTVPATFVVEGAAVAIAGGKAALKEMRTVPATSIANRGTDAVAGIKEIVIEEERGTFVAAPAAQGTAVTEAVPSSSPSEANPAIPERRSPPRHGFNQTSEGQVTNIETEAIDELCVVLHSYTHQQPDELDLCRGDLIRVRLRRSDGWSAGRIVRCAAHAEQAKGVDMTGPRGQKSSRSVEGQRGMFPSNRVARTTAPLAWERSERSKTKHRQMNQTGEGSGDGNLQLDASSIDHWDQGFEVDDPAAQPASPKHGSQSWMPPWRKKHQLQMLAKNQGGDNDPQAPQLPREQYQLLMLRRYQNDVEEEEGERAFDEDLESWDDIQSRTRQQLEPPPLPLPTSSDISNRDAVSDIKATVENNEQEQRTTRTVKGATSSPRLQSCVPVDEYQRPVAQDPHAGVVRSSSSDNVPPVTTKPIAGSSLVATQQQHCQHAPLATERETSHSERNMPVCVRPPEPMLASSSNLEVTSSGGQLQPWRRDLQAQQQNRVNERRFRSQDETRHTHAHEEQRDFQQNWRKRRHQKQHSQPNPETLIATELLPSSIEDKAVRHSNPMGRGVEPPPSTWKASFRLPSSHSSDASDPDHVEVVMEDHPHASSQRNQADDELSSVDTHDFKDKTRTPELAPAEPASALVTPVRPDLRHGVRRNLHTTPPPGLRLNAGHDTILDDTVQSLAVHPRNGLSSNDAPDSNVRIASPHLTTIQAAAGPKESSENVTYESEHDTRRQAPGSAHEFARNPSLGLPRQQSAISHLSKPTLTQRFMEAVHFTLSGCVSESLAASQLKSEVGQLRNQLQHLNRGLVENTRRESSVEGLLRSLDAQTVLLETAYVHNRTSSTPRVRGTASPPLLSPPAGANIQRSSSTSRAVITPDKNANEAQAAAAVHTIVPPLVDDSETRRRRLNSLQQRLDEQRARIKQLTTVRKFKNFGSSHDANTRPVYSHSLSLS